MVSDGEFIMIWELFGIFIMLWSIKDNLKLSKKQEKTK
jgi:hypothetical protein